MEYQIIFWKRAEAWSSGYHARLRSGRSEVRIPVSAKNFSRWKRSDGSAAKLSGVAYNLDNSTTHEKQTRRPAIEQRKAIRFEFATRLNGRRRIRNDMVRKIRRILPSSSSSENIKCVINAINKRNTAVFIKKKKKKKHFFTFKSMCTYF